MHTNTTKGSMVDATTPAPYEGSDSMMMLIFDPKTGEFLEVPADQADRIKVDVSPFVNTGY